MTKDKPENENDGPTNKDEILDGTFVSPIDLPDECHSQALLANFGFDDSQIIYEDSNELVAEPAKKSPATAFLKAKPTGRNYGLFNVPIKHKRRLACPRRYAIDKRINLSKKEKAAQQSLKTEIDQFSKDFDKVYSHSKDPNFLFSPIETAQDLFDRRHLYRLMVGMCQDVTAPQKRALNSVFEDLDYAIDIIAANRSEEKSELATNPFVNPTHPQKQMMADPRLTNEFRESLSKAEKDIVALQKDKAILEELLAEKEDNTLFKNQMRAYMLATAPKPNQTAITLEPPNENIQPVMKEHPKKQNENRRGGTLLEKTKTNDQDYNRRKEVLMSKIEKKREGTRQAEQIIQAFIKQQRKTKDKQRSGSGEDILDQTSNNLESEERLFETQPVKNEWRDPRQKTFGQKRKEAAGVDLHILNAPKKAIRMANHIPFRGKGPHTRSKTKKLAYSSSNATYQQMDTNKMSSIILDKLARMNIGLVVRVGRTQSVEETATNETKRQFVWHISPEQLENYRLAVEKFKSTDWRTTDIVVEEVDIAPRKSTVTIEGKQLIHHLKEDGMSDDDYNLELTQKNESLHLNLRRIEANIQNYEELRFECFYQIVTHTRSGNEMRLNRAVIACDPQDRKALLELKKIPFFGQEYKISIEVSKRQCHKCCGLGHLAKFCRKNTQVCQYCTGDHRHNECPLLTRDENITIKEALAIAKQNEELRCINCISRGFEDINHAANSTNLCETYQQYLARGITKEYDKLQYV